MAREQLRVESFHYESASCDVNVRGRIGLLLRVYSKTRGQGHASGLLRAVTEWADANGIELRLRARAYSGPIQTMLTNKQLVRFYRRHGFQVADIPDGAGGTIMIRPRTKNTSYDERENRKDLTATSS